MQLVGRDTGDLRLPMTPLEPAELDQLRETLFAFGIQEAAAVS
jgi:4-hydroxy-tetrahydrodipicolinate synthase